MDAKSGDKLLCDKRSSAKKMKAAVAVVGTPTPSTAEPGPGEPRQKVYTGTVTKLHDKFGFVDEDIFFETSVVKGAVSYTHLTLPTKRIV